jgi:predicted DNA-binding protein with PD1-like motif
MKNAWIREWLIAGALVLAVAGAAGTLSTATFAKSPGGAAEEAVPDAYTLTSHFTRVVVVRMKNQVDMLEGLRTAVAREKIKNAVILSGVGSLVSYHVHVVSNTTFPSTLAFTKEEGPFDLISTNGYVLDGAIHCHITMATPQKALGGHLELGTRVFTFAIVTLGVLDDSTSLKRFDDKNWR